MKNQDYHDKSAYKKTRTEKLQEAIAWLRERGRYCLEVPLNRRIYEPLHGSPLEPVK